MSIKNAIIFSGGGGTDISDANAGVGDVLAGKTFYAGSEPKKTGTMTDNGTVSTDITAKAQEVTIAAGKHSGSGVVKISAAEQAKIIAGNIVSGIDILGVTGTAEAAPAEPTTGLLKWGKGDYWAGTGWYPPTFLNSDNDWDKVALGDIHGLAIKAGKLYSWGAYGSFRVGQGATYYDTAVVKQVGTETDWWKISAGYDHSLGIRKTSDGSGGWNYTLWAWGEGAYGATGFGSTADVNTPTQVGTDTDWEDISAGYRWSCAIKGGKLYTCGQNLQYRTGQNTASGNTTVWTSYDSSTGWTSCMAGFNFGLGVKSGELWGWGENGKYALGTGSSTDLAVPTQINASTDWSHGSAGYEHSLMIKTDGTLWGAGEASFYRFGNLSQTDLQSWTQIGSDTDWEMVNCSGNASVSSLANYSFAIKGGGLYVAGDNKNGAMGVSPEDVANVFSWTQLGDGTNFVDIGAGSAFGMAIRKTT